MKPATRPRQLLALTLLALLGATEACSSAHYPRGVQRAMRDWNRPAEAFRVIGNIYFVGTNELAIYLITTPAGHFLLDSGLEETPPLIRANVERLGFRFTDVKILLSTHAHADHIAGHAAVKAMTGARVLASPADATVIRSGGGGPLALDMKWPPTPVDAELTDGQAVELGGTTLVAHFTPGHTPGATTWTTTVDDAGQHLAVVFFSSATLFAETPLVGNAEYPGIVADFERAYAFWNAVPCDVPLGPHVGFFGFNDKRARLAHGEPRNPFIDPAGWKRVIAEQEANFRRRLASR
jgi:metallo-beta-lactamase class B